MRIPFLPVGEMYVELFDSNAAFNGDGCVSWSTWVKIRPKKKEDNEKTEENKEKT